MEVEQIIKIASIAIAIAILLYFYGTVSEFVITNIGLNQIVPISFPENKWFSVTDARITNNDRSNYVFPLDHLHYHVIFSGKTPYYISIIPQLKVLVGNDNVTFDKTANKLDLEKGGTNNFDMDFSLVTDSVNQINLNLN